MNKVIQPIIAGMERCGSTFIYQVLKKLGKSPIKTHGFYKGSSEDFHIVVIRDPRDMLCSYAKSEYAKYELQEAIKKSLHRVFVELKRDKGVLNYFKSVYTYRVVKYEDYFNGNEIELIETLAGWLEIKNYNAHKILEECSIEVNKKRASKFNNFFSHDKNTNIHGDHITNDGKSGAWKKDFSAEVSLLVHEQIGYFIEKLGYKL